MCSQRCWKKHPSTLLSCFTLQHRTIYETSRLPVYQPQHTAHRAKQAALHNLITRRSVTGQIRLTVVHKSENQIPPHAVRLSWNSDVNKMREDNINTKTRILTACHNSRWRHLQMCRCLYAVCHETVTLTRWEKTISTPRPESSQPVSLCD